MQNPNCYMISSHLQVPASDGRQNQAAFQEVTPIQAGEDITAPLPVPLAYTVEEAAAALHVSTKTIRRLLARGILTSSKALRKKLIPRQQIEDFLNATCDVPRRIR